MSQHEVDARCADSAVHSHDDGKTLCQFGRPFVNRYIFEWRKPRVTAYRAADRRTVTAGLNRYPGIVIGAYIQIRQRVIGITWGAPGAVRRVQR
ncbi:hypothetical protein PSN13_06520 [Micromonospora saelicesensis]|uniref:Uncharacterized protein n=1 Tax=Micromonospora saelicesensis TaxID=285676 RepID=A0A328NFB3_9ACTN|nr:hypothetical protein [Micromonospora saelicesensis]RAO26492.1 hypothetical protein PSN13_06520 [Micromonospora saelicesensis]